MKVKIIYKKGQPIGWSIRGKSSKGIKKAAIIRDLQFFGFEDTAIKYAGRSDSDDPNGNPGTLTWQQKGK